MLTAKAADSVSRSRMALRRSTANSMSGGVSDSDRIELAVIAQPASPVPVVTTETPVANIPMMRRCSRGSKSGIGCSISVVPSGDRRAQRVEPGDRIRAQPDPEHPAPGVEQRLPVAERLRLDQYAER